MKKILPSHLYRYRFYIISTLIFIVWIMFFDRSNLITQFNLMLDLKKLRAEKTYYEKELENIKKDEKLVLGNFNALEKFAREKYLMKKEGEILFVIVDENDKPITE
jgi:cell division protein DivIC